MSFDLKEKFDKEAFSYFNSWPFMSHSSGSVLDGNAILYAGHYALLHYLLFDEYKLADSHSENIYRESVVSFGVISRGPHKWEDPQTHDDYMGLSTMSFLGTGYVARQIYDKGPCYIRKGIPGFRNWFNSQFWRIPGVWQHLKICAGRELNLFDKIFWSIGIVSTSFSKKQSTSGRILDWHLRSVYRIAKKNYWLCNKALDFVEKRNAKMYPNLMGDVFKIYFSSEHILSKWSTGIK